MEIKKFKTNTHGLITLLEFMDGSDNLKKINVGNKPKSHVVFYISDAKSTQPLGRSETKSSNYLVGIGTVIDPEKGHLASLTKVLNQIHVG